VTTVELAENLAAEEDCGEFPHVLGGVVLIGAAARLAAMLDRRFLDEAGWDPRTRVLSLPAEHRLLGRTVDSLLSIVFEIGHHDVGWLDVAVQ
jgi:hypothetical protein